ncbi:MAG: D-alanyl-D-alanine carboxypeptidase/D-alanyl-D-alanine-endopeptidase [Ilumatobacteraceae bacterium]
MAALVPALALGGCWRFADGKAGATSSGVVVSPTATEGPTGSTTVSTPSSESVTTPLLSVRRQPGTLSRDVNLAAFTKEIEAFLPQIDDTSCAAVSVDGQFVAASHEDVPLRPASNVKLLTAAVALEVLGPTFTYRTQVRGTATDGIVPGDLYLVGGGDPLLSSDWWKGPNTKYPPFNITPISSLAKAVRDAGITRVEGSVVGDASRYDDEWYAPTWGSDVRFTEGGPISALLVNDSRESNTQSSNDPSVGAATVLIEELGKVGVTVGGGPSSGVAPADAPLITDIASQPMTAVVQEMLTTSDNNTAEMVLKEIGFTRAGTGSREAGLQVVQQTMQGWGTPLDGMVLVDGSGLSDQNRLTCATLLSVMQHQSIDDPLGQGLAVAGAAGGTLADAFVGTDLEGALRGKTGTLYNYDDGTGGKPAAKALSGFVPVVGGGAIEFAMLLNGPQVAEKVVYRPIWDAFGAALLTYPSGPSAAELGPR